MDFIRKNSVLCILGFTVGILHGVTASGGMEDMTRLVQAKLDGYNPLVSPRLDVESPVVVKVTLIASAITSLDTKEQILKMRGHIKFKWTDPRLKWEQEDYGGIPLFTVPQSYIWRPDIVFLGIQGNPYIGSDETQVLLFSDGTVIWNPAFTSAFNCEVNIPKYPMDVNVCPILVSPWSHYNSSVFMVLDDPDTTLEETVKNGQFYISALDAIKRTFPYESLFYEELIFHIQLARIPTHVILNLLFPMFLSGLLGPLAFLIPPDDTEKISVSVTVFLATAVFIGVIHDDLPDRSDETPSVAVYVVSLLILAFCGVLGNIVVLLVHRTDGGGGNEECSPDQYPQGCLRKDSTGDSSLTHRLSSLCAADETNLSPDKMKMKISSQEVFRERVSDPCTRIAGPESSSKPRSRAERLNWMLFITNTLSLLVITVVMFAYIFT